MWHYDLRLVCDRTGELEATEDIGLTFEQAVRTLQFFQANHPRAIYRIVSCDARGSDRVHDVDLSHHVHMNIHEGFDYGWLGYIGAPTDARIEETSA